MAKRRRKGSEPETAERPKFVVPKHTQALRDEAHKAASVAAQADMTDPFVYGRVFAHMMNGIGLEHAAPSLRPE